MADIKKDAARNYLRFTKVRHYLDILYYAQKRVTKDVRRVGNISLREVKFLLQLQLTPDCSLVSVQKKQYLPSSTAAWLADNLVKKGYIQRRQNPKNRREVVLTVTPKGEDLLTRIDQHFFTPEVEDRLSAASDRTVAEIEHSLRQLCGFYGEEIKD